MREQSHLEEMRAAVRGDRERARDATRSERSRSGRSQAEPREPEIASRAASRAEPPEPQERPVLPAAYSTLGLGLNIARTVISAIFTSSQSEKFSM